MDIYSNFPSFLKHSIVKNIVLCKFVYATNSFQMLMFHNFELLCLVYMETFICFEILHIRCNPGGRLLEKLTLNHKDLGSNLSLPNKLSNCETGPKIGFICIF